MSLDNKLPWQQEDVIIHSQQLLSSFHYWTGDFLLSPAIASDDMHIAAQALFKAPFVVVAHGMEADPVLNYGNQAALELWQMDWQSFTRTPSRYTAEPMQREERDRLLHQAKTQGFISNYRGIRISSTGQRFYIDNAIIWNVLDKNNCKCGQAATFKQWQPV